MSDLISRSDAICEVLVNDGIENIVDRINALPSADTIEFDFNKYPPRVRNKVCDDTPSADASQNLAKPNKALKGSDLISRGDAIEHLKNVKVSYPHADISLPIDLAIKAIEILPSADADGEDLIIKCAKGIQDGLYNIKDGKLFKYKANGGTVRTYPIVPSADAVQGEWEHWGSPFSDESEVIDTIVCSVCGARFIEPKDEPKGEYNYCPNCGARMKGGAE